MFRLDDRVALVTGAAQGIGRKIAEVLTGAGAVVISADFSQWDSDLEEIGASHFGIRLDVTEPEQIKEVVGQVVDRFEHLDILVNNAGIVRDTLLLRMKQEAWDQVLKTNLDGVFLMTKEVVARMMRQRYGRIVNLSSVVGLMGNPGQANYAASKAGVVGFTKAVAQEVASRNITVNAVAPGYIETRMTEKLNDKAKADLTTLIPMGRIGTVEDVAQGVLFLASEEAGYITGHVLNINGGMYM